MPKMYQMKAAKAELLAKAAIANETSNNQAKLDESARLKAAADAREASQRAAQEANALADKAIADAKAAADAKLAKVA